ncbi:MAG: DNA-processing protein DprA [Candidatus Woesebacteria bacterium]|jgi:DNA processing protein
MLSIEKQNWLALLSINGIGKKTFFNCYNALIKHQISWEEFWVGRNSIWQHCSLNEKQQKSIKKFKKEHSISSYYQSLLEKKISVLTYKDASYPSLLQQIDDKPVLLFIKTKTNNFLTKTKNNSTAYYWDQLPVAIVGSRKITVYGRQVTEKISKELALLGATIISGFMYGVDLLAQKTAFKWSRRTVGILGFGFDYMYPRSQKRLFEQMLEQGAIFVTEYAPHVRPKFGQFPVRNRIIAGMSLATLVTEAALKSGSLITVQAALDYGRDVFTVPGPITSPYSEGTKKLINDGATLISSGKELIKELSSVYFFDRYQRRLADFTLKSVKKNQAKKVSFVSKDAAIDFSKIKHSQMRMIQAGHKNKIKSQKQLEKDILLSLKTRVLNTDDLAKLFEIKVAKLNIVLTFLELRGLIEKTAEGWVRR